MMNSTWIGSALVLGANLIAAISQIFLKVAAGRQYKVWWRSYVNPLVIIAYSLFVGTTIMNVFALRYISLSLSAALGASGQIFVPIISSIYLKEKINQKGTIGMILIVIGIILFSI